MRCKCKITACHERERSMKLNFTKSLKRLSLLTSLAAALPPLPSPLWLPPAARISISCFQAHMWVCRGCCVCMSNCRVEGGWGKTSPVNFFFVSPPFPLGATQRASTAATPASPFLFLASFQITSHNRLPLQGERGEWGGGGLGGRYYFSTTMEIQSENGEEVARAASAPSCFAPRRASVPQVETADEPVLREDLRAAKGVERFDIPLDNLKRMFEKPAVVNVVSDLLLQWILPS